MDAFAKLMTQCCSEQIVLKGDTGWKVDQSNLHEIQLKSSKVWGQQDFIFYFF